MPDDPIEAVELDRVADWRIKNLGKNPSDSDGVKAIKLLQRLADDLRRLTGSPVYAEYRAICGWLDKYAGVLTGFAKETFGA